MRTLGSSEANPRSWTWPSTWPLPFCERALPRWTPRPKKAVAASRIVQRPTGRPRISRKPRPFSTSSSTRAFSLRPSIGSGKSDGLMAAMSTSRATSFLAALSTSAISAALSGISHSVLRDISGPYQAAGAGWSRGSSGDVMFVSMILPVSGFPGKARCKEIVVGDRQAIVLGGVDQRGANAGLERAVAGVGDDDEARLGPRAGQGLGRHRRTDDVVAALHDRAGMLAHAVDVGPRPALGQEGAVGKVVRFDARQREREAAVIRFERRARRRIERR